MSAFTYPGVYIEELPSGVHTITGVATSIAAFVGWADQGPVDEALLVQSWLDFQNQFGGLDLRSLLGYSVNQFFGNGGQQAYIVRLVQSSALPSSGGATTATPGGVTVSPSSGTGSYIFAANSVGAWSNSYGIMIGAGSSATTFTVMVVYAPAGAPLAVVESFTNVTIASFVATVGASKFVVPTLSATEPTAIPGTGFFILTGGTDGNGITVPAATAASVEVQQPPSSGLGFTFTASNPGAWGNLVAISATPQTSAMDPTGTRFNLNIIAVGPRGAPTVVESYNNLCVTASDPYYVKTVLNSDSNYVTVTADGVCTQALSVLAPAALSTTAPTPVTGTFLTGGYDGIVLDPTLDNTSGGLFKVALNASGGPGTGGVHLLDSVPIFNLLCVPGESDESSVSSLQMMCSNNRAFYIVDSPIAANTSAVTTQLTELTGTKAGSNPGPIGSDGTSISGAYSANAAYYFPWVLAPDPLAGGRSRYFPPCGFVAGIYAATDASRGVWKAPAGIDAALSGVSGLQYVLTDAQNGSLNPYAVNCLRQFRVYGNVVWGARTMQGADAAASQWKYVPIRRFALFLESSLYDGTQWAVFEPNDATLWGQLRLNVGSFMQGLFLQGAFQGTTPQQAYFVKCDAENNPQSSIDQGIVNVLVGFAPLYPAEFVVIQIQQMAGQSQS
ncbi:MAG: phage tail sheath C-terminal domain-containing protein [Acidobacteriaceae bacterium]